ncbi:putative 11-oxo-beta-amyrin 30-oxidase [Rosa chinensis]|uniref:Putative 11-oxo-beta-amyrin 30-oxidase n=1 Tax=Rosa chinensis TaxID=74649 RepID=A0A2P6Q9E6_ROSCH|nr:cytochrome P450 CYP72A219 [Rosa chinensis]PRQ30802.1 putative 11-oxo-beta-amyrin 30-oxidase [Rosa chinensis]
MEVTVASWAALSLVFVSIIARWVWGVLDWLWFKPKKLERSLRELGLKGNSYRFMYGDLKENANLLEQASSKPMNLSTSHDIVPRVTPFDDQALKTYGKDSFVWIGTSPMVNIMNPEDVKAVLTKMDNFPKPEASPLIKLLAQGIAAYEGEKWVKHRRIINPTFHVEKLKRMFPAFHESCDDMIKEWESSVSKRDSSCELDVFPSLQHLTADVISRTAFGSSYQEGRKIFELLKEQTGYALKAVHTIYIPGWRFVPTKMNKRMKQIDKEIRGLLKGIIIKREQAIKAGEATKDDLLGALLESSLNDIQERGKNNKSVGMSIEDVIEECKLFYFAGQETTSVLLVWTMILLSQNQNWQERARQEVLQVFGSNKPDFDGLTHLKVVTMILLEVLRLYPPLVMMSRTVHKKTQLKKFSLPAGVEVSLPTLLIHHDKELWGDDANEFKPERFSEGVSKATKNQLSFFPFGAGPRICVGQNFAMIEAKLALSLILQHFTFELSPSYTHAPSSLIILQPQYGAPIILHKR